MCDSGKHSADIPSRKRRLKALTDVSKSGVYGLISTPSAPFHFVTWAADTLVSTFYRDSSYSFAWAENYVQRGQASQTQIVAPHQRFGVECQVRYPAQNRLECNLAFNAR